MRPDGSSSQVIGGEGIPGPPGTVLVVGLGLMGGSLARALKALPEPPGVLGVDPDPVQGSLALEAGAVDRFDPEGIGFLGEADLVVYAAPLGETLRLLREHRGLWGEDALLTDVVSLKAPLLDLAAREGFGKRFVGAHPLCGGEGSGFGASRDDLFRGGRVFLCRDEGTSEGAAAGVEGFWQALGAGTEWVDAGEHDRRMAWVSHLPQLVANALAGALDAAGWSPDDLGPAGRDMTRLAGSSPAVWKDLFTTSAPLTGAGLTSVSRALNVLADLLARRDMDRIAEFMERTRDWRSGEAAG
jgi:prephenate dehydrogenase